MAFSLLDLEDQQQPATSLLPLPDDRPAALQPDPRAEALGGLYQQVMDRIAEEHRRALWSPDNPIGTETVQTLGRPQQTVHAGPVGQYIDPATGRMTEQGQARMADNPALGFDTGGLSTGGLLGVIKAYHGSPHQFDAFDMSKIGTGEGAQAYGHGMYLAENEGVARGYRDALTNKHQPPDLVATQDALLQEIGASNDKAAALAARGFEYDSPEIRAAIDPHEQNIKALQDKLSAMPKPTGHMYEVNVNADPERFLHWDKPLSEQHPDVQAALEKTGQMDYARKYFEANARRFPNGPTGEDLHEFLKTAHGNNIRPAEILNEAGIPGIRYLDQGSRGAGEGSHNYVIFDANTMEIIRRYGLAGLMAGGGAAALSRQQPEQ